MNRLLPLLVALLNLSWAPALKIKVIDKHWYRVGYSEELREPVWVEYEVQCTQALFSRKGLKFYPEPGVTTSTDQDYTNNPWDKGHMAPAADFACDSLALLSTFSYVNAALQHQRLNRGAWKELEAEERRLAQDAPVKVRIDILFEGEPRRVATGARIPSSFIKKISYRGYNSRYHFPNDANVGTNPEEYIVYSQVNPR